MLVIAWGSPGKSHGDGRNLPIAFGTSGITGVTRAAICGKFIPIGDLCSCRARSPRPLKWRCATSPRHAHAADAPASPDSPRGWVYEEKVDGSRMVAHKNGNTVHLISRQGKEFTQRFPELAKAVAALGAESVISSSSADSNGSGLSRRAMWPRRPCSWSLTCWSSTARTSGSDPCANADKRLSIS